MNRLLALFVVVECEKLSNAEPIGNLSPQPILVMQANNPPRANLMQQGIATTFLETKTRRRCLNERQQKMTKRPPSPQEKKIKTKQESLKRR